MWGPKGVINRAGKRFLSIESEQRAARAHEYLSSEGKADMLRTSSMSASNRTCCFHHTEQLGEHICGRLKSVTSIDRPGPE
jgi:hypothetical protein